MSKALIAGIVILSLITGMAGGLGASYFLIEREKQEQQPILLEITNASICSYDTIDITVRNNREATCEYQGEKGTFLERYDYRNDEWSENLKRSIIFDAIYIWNATGYTMVKESVGNFKVPIAEIEPSILFPQETCNGQIQLRYAQLAGTLQKNETYYIQLTGFDYLTNQAIYSNIYEIKPTSPTPVPPEGKMIKYDSAFINATSDMVTVYVRNWGTEQVTLDKVYIDAEDYTQSVTSPAGFTTAGALLNVDEVVKITVNGTAAGLDFIADSTYKVKVTGPGVEWEESVRAS